jgi:hypothetical protein
MLLLLLLQALLFKPTLQVPLLQLLLLLLPTSLHGVASHTRSATAITSAAAAAVLVPYDY